MKVLMIAPEPFFTPRGTPFSVYYRTLVAAGQGVRIDLLTYGQGADVAIPGVRIVRIPRFSWLGPVPVGPSFQKLFLDIWMVLWTIMLLLRHRYAVVHAHEESVFWCRYLKPLFGFKLAYDMHSSLPQQLTNFRFSNSELLIRIFAALERSALAHSDAVITICPDLDDYARAQARAAGAAVPDRELDLRRRAPRQGAGALLSPWHRRRSGRSRSGRASDRLRRHIRALSGRGPPGREPSPKFTGSIQTRELLLVGGRPDQVDAIRALVARLGLGAACRLTGQVPKPAARVARRALRSWYRRASRAPTRRSRSTSSWRAASPWSRRGSCRIPRC